MRNESEPILVVEDEGLIAVLLKEVLADLGLKPKVFNEGEPALASLEATRYSAAVLDLGLPDLDGNKIVNALLARDPLFRIVLTTGLDPQEVEERYAHAPNVRVLSKPFDIAMLEDELALLDIARPARRPPMRVTKGNLSDFVDVRMIA
jgi:CheY-like chemotaxis protein